ncbi:MAG: DsrE family protein [Candidatus Eisenbacteria bacterium]|nr:DsrE family protein [Candidatus Eisenbacteria bacterium]
MATITVIVGEPPYGKERVYTTLRFVLTALHEGHAVNLFLIEDSVLAPKKGQKPSEMPGVLDEKMPNCEELVKAAIKAGAKVKICGNCALERSLNQGDLVEGVEVASMRDFVRWVLESDKVVSF